MSHDTHFLSRLSRVSDEHVSLALSLYRDPGMVKELLARARLPDGAARVALALADGPEAPHVVLARDGHFVTCLGPGMTTGDLPLITRAKLDSVATQVADLRLRLEHARRLTGGNNEAISKVLLSLLERGRRVTREEFLGHSSLVPLIPHAVLDLCHSLHRAIELERAWLSSHPRNDAWNDRAAQHARTVWGFSHLSALLLDAPQMRSQWILDDPAHVHGFVDLFLATPLRMNLLGPWMRAMAGMALIGKPLVRPLKEHLRSLGPQPTRTHEGQSVVPALMAVGIAHPSLRAELGKLLGGLHPALVTAIEEPEKDQAAVLEYAYAPIAGVLETLGLEAELARSAPVEIRLGVLSAWALPIRNEHRVIVVEAMSVAAPRQPVDFYLPEAAAKLVELPSDCVDGKWMFNHWHDSSVRRPEARRVEVPGRNEACSCGSGRKFKKCCGAG